MSEKILIKENTKKFVDPKEKIKQNVSKSLSETITHLKSELDSVESTKKKNIETQELLMSEIEKLISEYEAKELQKLDDYKKTLEKQYDVLKPDLKASSLKEILEKSQLAKESLVDKSEDDCLKLHHNKTVLNREIQRCIQMSFKPVQKIKKEKELEEEIYSYSSKDLRTQLTPVFKFLNVPQTKNFVADIFSIRTAVKSGKIKKQLLEYAFSFYDCDKNGFIDQKEFEHLLLDMGNALFPEYMEEMTKEIEKHSELDNFMKHALMQHIQVQILEDKQSLNEDVKLEFDTIDENHDNKVSFEEFSNYFDKFFIAGLKRLTSKGGIEKNFVDTFDNLDLFGMESDGSQFLEMDLSVPLKNKICTGSFTKKNFVQQKIYRCLDCSDHHAVGTGLCEVCIEVCHKGHNTKLLDTGYYYCVCVSKKKLG